VIATALTSMDSGWGCLPVVLAPDLWLLQRASSLRGILDHVEGVIDGGTVRWAVLDGGPVDGRVDPLEPQFVELCVVMTDGQRHVYERTEARRLLPSGAEAVVFEWSGRQFGLQTAGGHRSG
jgi:hypothetical protein